MAAVFSYVVLGAGFFTTGEAQRVVHTGSQQASSSLEIIGNVYGYATSAGNGNLESIEFTIGNTAGGTPIDISQMLVTYTCENDSTVISYAGTDVLTDNTWNITKKYNEIGENTLLEPGEQFVLKVMISPKKDKQFTVNLQPAVGAVYPIKKTVPPYLNKVNIL